MSTLALHRSGPPIAAGDVPLVLLHGFPLDSRMWSPTLDLMPDVPAIAVDAPGFGASPALVDDEPSLDLFANAVVAALGEAGVARGVVVGLSMGGYVALSLAERHPQVLAGLGLLDTKPGADDDGARAKRLAVADAALSDTGADAVAPMVDTVLSPVTHAGSPETVARVRQWLAEAPPAGIAWAQQAMAARPDRLHVLAGLDVPALVLRGEDDALATPADHEAMADALGVDVVVVPHAGHLPALENPEETAAALRALYAGVAGS